METKKNKIDKIISRDIDFAKWYTDVIKNSDLIEYGPVKGTLIYKPYGYAIWENIQNLLDKEFKKIGVENVQFPLLIPEQLFLKEKKHIEGFAPELWTVTKIGENNLSEKLFIRPTSETLIADFWSRNIKSYRDLPKIYNQWVNVMRAEKTTRPFLRGNEFMWQEGHTIHETKEQAKEMTLKILNVYKKFIQETLMISVLCGEKTEHEKFAGAKNTFTLEALMYDGKALQSATSHYFDQNFTKAFNIKFQSRNQIEQYPYSTSWGLSTRIIGAIIMSHADDCGLVLPFNIAPIQIVIIKVKDDEKINNVINNIKNNLSKKYRLFIDDSDKSFGFKISDAEIRGIPIRIEIGLKDLSNNVVTLSLRNNKVKSQIKINELNEYIDKQVIVYDQLLFEQSNNNLNKNIQYIEKIEQYNKLGQEFKGFIIAPFCGNIICEDNIRLNNNISSRCVKESIKDKQCFNCEKKAEMLVYFAKAY